MLLKVAIAGVAASDASPHQRPTSHPVQQTLRSLILGGRSTASLRALLGRCRRSGRLLPLVIFARRNARVSLVVVRGQRERVCEPVTHMRAELLQLVLELAVPLVARHRGAILCRPVLRPRQRVQIRQPRKFCATAFSISCFMFTKLLSVVLINADPWSPA
jgi:hypothetical protein